MSQFYLLLADCVFWGTDVYKQNYRIRFKTTQILIAKEEEQITVPDWRMKGLPKKKPTLQFFQFQEFAVLKPANSLMASRWIVKAEVYSFIAIPCPIIAFKQIILCRWNTSDGSTSAWRQGHDCRLYSSCVEELVPVNGCRSGHCFWLRSQCRINVSVPVLPSPGCCGPHRWMWYMGWLNEICGFWRSFWVSLWIDNIVTSLLKSFMLPWNLKKVMFWPIQIIVFTPPGVLHFLSIYVT